MNRRDALINIAVAALLSGCQSISPRRISSLADVCESTNTGPTAKGTLVIDAHCHVFNGTDIQAKDFIGKVVKNEKKLDQNLADFLAAMATAITWGIAPCASDEIELLDKVQNKAMGFASLSQFASQSLEQARISQRKNAEDEFLRIYRESERIRNLLKEYFNENMDLWLNSPSILNRNNADLHSIEEALNKSSELSAQDVKMINQLPGIKEILELLHSMLQYRFANCFDIARTYSCKTGAVDLYCPSLVDFDHWLGDGQPTISPLCDQFVVMEKIMQLMGGNFHAFAPFNPWSHISDPNYFGEIKRAIMERGFIGIKLYPPMGFAPYGNKDIPASDMPPIWNKVGTPTGEEFDNAMSDLYQWCHENAVPILAHAGLSFGPDNKSDAMGSPENWGKALHLIESLGNSLNHQIEPNICFGHIGGTYLPDDKKPAWAKEFASLCIQHQNAYGDLSYWDFLLKESSTKEYSAAINTLRDILSTKSEMAEHLLYGSDWNLLLQETKWADYVQIIPEALTIAGASTSGIAQIMGANAANFLGLKNNFLNSNRARLNNLYSQKWKVNPLWQLKVDRLSAKSSL